MISLTSGTDREKLTEINEINFYHRCARFIRKLFHFIPIGCAYRGVKIILSKRKLRTNLDANSRRK